MKLKIIYILAAILFTGVLRAQDTTKTDDSQSDTISTEKFSDAYFILRDYIAALGGREKLDDVRDRTTVMTGTVQEFDIRMTIYQKLPSLLRQEVQASGLDQVIIFNGTDGVIITGEESRKIPLEEVKRIKYEAYLKLLLYPDSAGVKMEFSGIDTIKNSPVYKVRNSAEELVWYTYYDKETKLKLLEEKEVKTESGVFTQEIWFSDYKEVDGLKYPFKIEQKLGPQEINFSVISIKVNQGLDDELFEID